MLDTTGFTLTEEVYKHCNHQKVEIRKRVLNRGVVQYVRQCLYCGKSMSIAIKKELAYKENNGIEPKAFDEKLHDEYEYFRSHVFTDYQQKRIDDYREAQKHKQDEFFEAYSHYLNTDKWFEKREKVMIRANGICEGCHDNPAEHVHHLTYNHVFDELLFELVAVCRECHERIHPHMASS